MTRRRTNRKPWGRTVVVEDLAPYANPAQLVIDLREMDKARAGVEEQEAGEAMGRAVGVCKVLSRALLRPCMP